MKRSSDREIGPVVVATLCLIVVAGFAVWGISGAVVVTTLLVGVATVSSAAERADSGVILPSRTPRLTLGSDIQTSASAEATATAVSPDTAELPKGPSPAQVLRPVRRWVRLLRIESARQVATVAIAAIVSALALVFYLRDIGANPAGLFCDEAEIGLESYRLIRGDAELTSVPLFYHHFGYDLGILSPMATAPFVALFGLDDLGVRLTSAVLTLAMLVVVFVTLRRLHMPYALVAVAVYAFSPIVIHLSRVNFGHAPSMLLIVIGFDRFVVARRSGRRTPAAVAGLLWGVAAYGNPSFYILVPLVIGAVGFSEVVYNRREIRAYATYGLASGCAALWGVPLVYRALTDDEFWRRFKEKNAFNAPWFSTERLGQLIDNYPKYFSKAFLFDVGEVGLPGGFISRHSVAGAGVLNEVMLPVVLIGLVACFWLREDVNARFILPWVVVAVLYPLPDLISTSSDRPPYTLSLFGSSLCLPYLAGWGLHGVKEFGEGRFRWDETRLSRVLRRSRVSDEEGMSNPSALEVGPSLLGPIVAGVILIWALVAGWRFYDGPYQRYPNVSADYWGWQFGPRSMIGYFLDHQEEYDEFIMDGNFNEAYIFLDFYIRDPDVRRRASIGDLSRLDPDKHQLFGVRSETWNRMPGSQFPSKSYFVIDEVIPYPNGQDGMYLVELR